MNFLNPTAIAIAAGLTIPPLIALYFLKLKRMVKPVPSTLLWKRAAEDLRVNAPFQRLRSSLLLLLQLLILILAAIALGKPMLQTAQTHEDTLIILLDQSASMGVVEADGRSRLEIAKEQAGIAVDNMDDDARAMVIAFCDRATVVSSFDTDRAALKRKIESVKQTDSTSRLGEAMSLAEAFTQSMVIGRADGSDITVEGSTAPATIFLFTDGRIEDAETVSLQKFDVDSISVTNVGARTDNVAILSMDARRHYERPEVLEVAATVQNFGPEPVTFDAVLYVGGQNVDVKTIGLEPALTPTPEPRASARAGAPSFAPRRVGEGEDSGTITGSIRSPPLLRKDGAPTEPAPGSVGVVVFDEIEFEGGGVVEVVLRLDDALPADDHAWTIIDEPRHIRVLLVTEGNMFLTNVLDTLDLELVAMSPSEYEAADDDQLADGRRSLFDVVVMDRHSTSRLPRGNYFFFGAVPQIDGVQAGGMIDDQVIFNWDDTHPILRHVATETLFVYEWLDLRLPPEAVSIIEGETSPVLSYLTRDASQFVISAFALIVTDELGNPAYNTYWVTTVDFVVFMQNCVRYLAANLATVGRRSVTPGEPVTLPVPGRTREAKVHRPDGETDLVTLPEGEDDLGPTTINYARTRRVGTYRIEPGVTGQDVFAVNLFNPSESRVEPVETVRIGAESVEAQAATVEVNEPAWPFLLMALLVILLLEWVVYNRRVFV